MSCAPRMWLRRAGAATRRLSRLPFRAMTSAKPIPHMPVPMRFIPSSPGTRKSHVARSRLGDFDFARLERIGPAGRALQRGIHGEAGRAALRLRRIVRVAGRIVGRDHEDHSSPHERLHRVALRKCARCEVAARGERGAARLGLRSFDHGDGQRLGRPAAEGEPQDRREDDREDEHPEHGLGLAHELADARLRQLDERALNAIRRLGAQPSRSLRPVNDMNTSSSVA